MSIEISKAAIAEVQRLRIKQKKPDASFRLAVQRGGCAGMFYILDFDDTVQPSDRVYSCNGLQVVVEDENWQYIDGLTIDYSEDLMGGGFRFHNPNAAKTCGCGNSFSTSVGVGVGLADNLG